MKNFPSYDDFTGGAQSGPDPMITESSMGDYGQLSALRGKLSLCVGDIDRARQRVNDLMALLDRSRFEEATELAHTFRQYRVDLESMIKKASVGVQDLTTRMDDLNRKDLPHLNESFSPGYFGAEIKKCQAEIERLNKELEKLDTAYTRSQHKGVDVHLELQSIQSEVVVKGVELESFIVSRFGDRAGSVDPSSDPEIKQAMKDLERLERTELNLMNKSTKIDAETEAAIQAIKSNRESVKENQLRIAELNASWKEAFMNR